MGELVAINVDNHSMVQYGEFEIIKLITVQTKESSPVLCLIATGYESESEVRASC